MGEIFFIRKEQNMNPSQADDMAQSLIEAKQANATAKELAETALVSLRRLLTDESIKPSDTLSAIKVALDYSKQAQSECESDAVHVVFDNIPREYAG